MIEHLNDDVVILEAEKDLPEDEQKDLINRRKANLHATLSNREVVAEVLSDVDSGSEENGQYSFFVEGDCRLVVTSVTVPIVVTIVVMVAIAVTVHGDRHKFRELYSRHHASAHQHISCDSGRARVTAG